MTFQWPWQFEFPPFFTLQPNLATREKQLEAWARLIIDYCQWNKIYSIDLDEVAKSELFNNTKLNSIFQLIDFSFLGRLDSLGIKAVFDFLEQQSIKFPLNTYDRLEHVEWKDKNKKRCNIYWRRPEEWGQLIYEWASGNGLLNTIVTFYELVQGEDTISESFYGLESDVLHKAIQSLEYQKRAVFVEINNEKAGVKFF